jgi:hypothetical protein
MSESIPFVCTCFIYQQQNVVFCHVQIIKYKALVCIIWLVLTGISCADRDDEGHRRRRAHPRRSRVLRRGLLLRDRRADPQRRHGLARRHQHPHLRDQLLHAPHQDARPVDRPPALHDTVHRARVREVQGGREDGGLCKCSSLPTMSQSLASLPRLQTTLHPLSRASVCTTACTTAAGSCTSGGPACPAYFSSRHRMRSCLSTRLASRIALPSISCRCMRPRTHAFIHADSVFSSGPHAPPRPAVAERRAPPQAQGHDAG